MTPLDLAEFFADAIAAEHGCRFDNRNLETRKPCAHCQKTGTICADAWVARFRVSA